MKREPSGEDRGRRGRLVSGPGRLWTDATFVTNRRFSSILLADIAL